MHQEEGANMKKLREKIAERAKKAKKKVVAEPASVETPEPSFEKLSSSGRKVEEE